MPMPRWRPASFTSASTPSPKRSVSWPNVEFRCVFRVEQRSAPPKVTKPRNRAEGSDAMSVAHRNRKNVDNQEFSVDEDINRYTGKRKELEIDKLFRTAVKLKGSD